MGLTRIRAAQISDIDYKQSVRVITRTNITLSGSAPSVVDGVSLTAGDRILVAGQSNAAQNGLYQVQTLGTGENGTWARTSDANQDGEIQPGMVVMVTQGNQYADTPWKLTTNGEIIIGTTELVFVENYSQAFGNVFANGTAVIANTVSAPITLTAGNNIAITGNNISKTVTIGVTGISLSSISNGTSTLDIATANGNITSTVNDNTTLIVTDTGANVSGHITATGNVTGGNIVTSGQITATGNVTADAVLGNVTGTTANITANLTTSNIAVTNSVGSNLVPDADDTYSLGNATNRWSNLFLTGNTIQLGNLQLKDTDGVLQILQGDGANLAPISAATETSETAVFSDDAEFGDVDEAVTVSLDLGLVTEQESVEINLGLLVQAGILQPDQIVFPSYTVTTLPIANPAAQMVFVSDEVGGPVMAFSDGLNWRRVTDRAIVS